VKQKQRILGIHRSASSESVIPGGGRQAVKPEHAEHVLGFFNVPKCSSKLGLMFREAETEDSRDSPIRLQRIGDPR
jgi:hypothetical protein